jgi:hypothetical protein
VLTVVAGVDAKGASHEFACWRFLRNALQITFPAAASVLTPLSPHFVNRFDHES